MHEDSSVLYSFSSFFLSFALELSSMVVVVGPFHLFDYRNDHLPVERCSITTNYQDVCNRHRHHTQVVTFVMVDDL